MVPRYAFLAPDSVAGLPAAAYVLLYGPGHDALCPYGLLPRRYASVERRHYGVDLHYAHLLDDSLADLVQSDESRVLYGQDYFYENLLGLKFKITPFSFFQTNSLGAEVLYETARSYIGDTRDMTVFDLYSGTGTISQILAAVAKKVIGVEIVEEAVVAARENAERNGIKNCEFIAGDVLKVLDEIEALLAE